MIMAKYAYPAIFTKESNGYSVIFPDLESCYTDGNTLPEAIENAQDVLNLVLYKLEESEGYIASPSPVKGIKTGTEDFVSLISCDTIEYRKFFNSKAVKKTLTIPAWLNTIAERQGVNFSTVLQEGLKQRLNL
jgi:predicted RNase H-like HicB family nuclease